MAADDASKKASPQIEFRVPPGLKAAADRIIKAEGHTPAAFHRHIWINGLKRYMEQNAAIEQNETPDT